MKNENFKVRVAKIKEKEKSHPSDEYELWVTHNGWQWNSIGVTREELFEIGQAIDKFLKEN